MILNQLIIGKEADEIITSIEYGPSSELINSCTNGALKDLAELGTIFVHPNYQMKGIGSKMLNLIFVGLKRNGIKEFCLESGYKSSQKIWINKFGNPQYCLKDYWGEDADHMIWRIKVEDVLSITPDELIRQP